MVFHYRPGRKGEYAAEILDGFNGTIQVDAYDGYTHLATPKRTGGKPLQLAFCWAHGRRKLIAAKPKKGSPIVDEALLRIAALYKVEGILTLDRRAIRPLPPGRVQGNGSYAPDVDALITGDRVLSWAHRDRLTQTSPVIVDHTGASIGPEPGVSYSVEVRWVDPDTGTALLPPGIVIDAGITSSWILAPGDISDLGAPERTAEIDVAVRSRRLVEGVWLTDREARWVRLTAPFAAGWDRGWGYFWGT